MAYTELCCRSGGSNLNAGTRSGGSTEPGTGADFTYASGTWVAATGVFTVASGNPQTDGVAVGDFASVYADGASVTGFIGRVTARTTTTITVSLAAKAGTAPVDGTGTRTVKIGGAWKGPNGADGFPFGFVQNTLQGANGDPPRVNFKNDAPYALTGAATHAPTGVAFQGYATAYGDGARATVDGGTSGTAYTLLTLSGAANVLTDLIFQNNGGTASATAVSVTGSCNLVTRCVVNGVRGTGFAGNAVFVECEAYACNQSNTAGQAGFVGSATPSLLKRCISHDNTGSNASGFASGGNGGFYLENCVADSNGQYGIQFVGRAHPNAAIGCDCYNNGSDGILIDPNTSNGAVVYIENCNLVKNGGYGINDQETALAHVARAVNCGFGSGTQVNASGTVNGINALAVLGSVTYPADVTPWNDPANGDFRINSSAAKGTGRGSFTQTQGGYGGSGLNGGILLPLTG